MIEVPEKGWEGNSRLNHLLKYPHVFLSPCSGMGLYKRHKDLIPKLELWAPYSGLRKESSGCDKGRDIGGTWHSAWEGFLESCEWLLPDLKFWIFSETSNEFSGGWAAMKCVAVRAYFTSSMFQNCECEWMTLERVNSWNFMNCPPLPVVWHLGSSRFCDSCISLFCVSRPRDSVSIDLGGMNTGIFKVPNWSSRKPWGRVTSLSLSDMEKLLCEPPARVTLNDPREHLSSVTSSERLLGWMQCLFQQPLLTKLFWIWYWPCILWVLAMWRWQRWHPPTLRTWVYLKEWPHSQRISITHGWCRKLCNTQSILASPRKEIELCLGSEERKTNMSYGAGTSGLKPKGLWAVTLRKEIMMSAKGMQELWWEEPRVQVKLEHIHVPRSTPMIWLEGGGRLRASSQGYLLSLWPPGCLGMMDLVEAPGGIKAQYSGDGRGLGQDGWGHQRSFLWGRAGGGERGGPGRKREGGVWVQQDRDPKKALSKISQLPTKYDLGSRI